MHGNTPLESHLLKWLSCMSACEKWRVALEMSHLRGEPGKTCCSHGRFHRPQWLVIIAPLCSDWAGTPLELHLSEGPDKAEYTSGTSMRPRAKETTALFSLLPFLSSRLLLPDSFLRTALPCLIFTPMSPTTWPT